MLLLKNIGLKTQKTFIIGNIDYSQNGTCSFSQR